MIDIPARAARPHRTPGSIDTGISTAVSAVIAERYRLVGQLGRGGMGRVRVARDGLLDRDVAVKELVPPPGTPESAT